MTTVLASATQAALYQPVANIGGVAAATDVPQTTASGKNTSQASGKNPSQATGKNASQQPTGKNPSVQQNADTAGSSSQTTVSIKPGTTGIGSGWFWGFAVLFSVVVAFGIYFLVNRKK